MPSTTTHKPSRIAFGSCNEQSRHNKMWPIIESREPAAFVWGGDSIYADFEHSIDFSTWPPKMPYKECATPERVRHLYQQQLQVPGYKRIVDSNITVFGTIDDHDYGCDNADKTFPHRYETTNAFIDFIGEHQGSSMARRAAHGKGVYGVKLFDFARVDQTLVPESEACIDPDVPCYQHSDSSTPSSNSTSSTVPLYSNKSVAVFVLDVRTNKEPWRKGTQAYARDSVGDFLGEEQWQWFETAIANSQASVNVVVNGLQVNADLFPNPNIAESWSGFPQSQQRLLDAMLQETVSAPFLISGDVHMTQFMRKDCRHRDNSSMRRPIMEMTTSGMTHSWGRLHSLPLQDPHYEYPLMDRIHTFVGSISMHMMHYLRPWTQIPVASEDPSNVPHDGGLEGAKQGLQYSLERNFGELEFDWEEQTISIRSIGEDGKPLLSSRVSMSQLNGANPMSSSYLSDHAFDQAITANEGYPSISGEWVCVSHRGYVGLATGAIGLARTGAGLVAMFVLPLLLSVYLMLLFWGKKKPTSSSKPRSDSITSAPPALRKLSFQRFMSAQPAFAESLDSIIDGTDNKAGINIEKSDDIAMDYNDPEFLSTTNPHWTASGLDSRVIDILAEKGITKFTPVQAEAFQPVMDGRDVIGRSRTGTGKTLAFGLPSLTRLSTLLEEKGTRGARGRPVSMLVLCPTRELARQVQAELSAVAKPLKLYVDVFHGGVSYDPQTRALRDGVDVLVGTPGRIIDHLERGNLKLSHCETTILDEADEMLNMGFAEDVEVILKDVGVALPNKPQCLLFSATTPSWVKNIGKNYQKDVVAIDATGNQDARVASTVRHMAIQVPPSAEAKRAILEDIIAVQISKDIHEVGAEPNENGTPLTGKKSKLQHAIFGKTIVFTETKREADEIASGSVFQSLSAQALHGDVSQRQRDSTLAAFKAGAFNVLVATDVAARGIDIQDVDLVVQFGPPRDVDTYVHRSGRTGRAGNNGVSVLMFSHFQESDIVRIEKDLGHGFQFDLAGPPSTAAALRAAAKTSAVACSGIPDETSKYFKDSAKALLEQAENPEDVVARCLAAISRRASKVESRSLLTGEVNMATISMSTPDQRNVAPRDVHFILGKLSRISQQQGGIPIDCHGFIRLNPTSGEAIFDLDAEAASELIKLSKSLGDIGASFSILHELEIERRSNFGQGRQSDRNRNGGRNNGRGRDRNFRSRDNGRSQGRRNDYSNSYSNSRKGGREWADSRRSNNGDWSSRGRGRSNDRDRW
eukprot:Nitzschia sp. Nitz4//scaffold30_size153850//50267//55164//NITZ4_002770-RA/size153850-processed-gene-0.39-mRNA-1//-1//CDS//3329547238//2298//frame0